MTPSITLVLPAHNEGEGIYTTLLEIDSSITEPLELTIFVSEDGSQDNTREEVIRASNETKNCKVQLSEKSDRLGYSKGVLRGIQECKTEYIGFMDADGQCDPKDIATLLAEVKNGLVICGYRNPRSDSKLRLFYSNCFRLAYRLFGGPKLEDPSSPFILCKKSDITFLEKTNPKLSYGFWWEFQIRINAAGLKVKQLPVNHRNRITGQTQVYKVNKLPKIVVSHLNGLYRLKCELKNN
jgi:dolichol-phosphate mannosyltransferase